jgi:hypothetical protein
MNSRLSSYESDKFKDCAGRGCSENGIHYLKIHFINKCGWFCDSCKNTLVDGKLADEATVNCGD